MEEINKNKLIKLSVEDYLNLLGSKQSAPGGGSCNALVLSLASSLMLMGLNYTLNKKGYERYQDDCKYYLEQFTNLREKTNSLIDEDAIAYLSLMDAFKTKDQKLIEEKARYATSVPLSVYEIAKTIIVYGKKVKEFVNKNLLSDIEIGLELAKSVIDGAKENVMLNVIYLPKKEQDEILEQLK